MSRDDQRRRLAETRARADHARQRFAAALASTRNRLTPAHLKADALAVASGKAREAKQSLRRSIRHRPLLTAAAALGALALLFWAPARHLAVFGARASQLVWINRKLWKSSDD